MPCGNQQVTFLHALGKLRMLQGLTNSLDIKKLFAMSILLSCLTRTMGFVTIGEKHRDRRHPIDPCCTSRLGTVNYYSIEIQRFRSFVNRIESNRILYGLGIDLFLFYSYIINQSINPIQSINRSINPINHLSQCFITKSFH